MTDSRTSCKITEYLAGWYRMRAESYYMLVVKGQARQTDMAAGSGQEEFIVAYSYVRLKFIDQP